MKILHPKINMTKNYQILLVLVTVALLGAVGYFKAVPTSNKDEAPKIEVAPNSFDFGEIEFGKIAEYSFKLKNTGDQNLKISRVATSCACTSAKILQEELAAGQETELRVRYDTAAMGSGSHGKGRQERIIYIKSNDPVTPQIEVIIYAFVK